MINPISRFHTAATLLVVLGLIAVLALAMSAPFMMPPLLNIPYLFNVLLQFLNVGGLFPHEGHLLSKWVEVPLGAELHPRC